MCNSKCKEAKNLTSIYDRELEVFSKIYNKKSPLLLFLACICEEKADNLENTFTTSNYLEEFSTHVILNPFSLKYGK